MTLADGRHLRFVVRNGWEFVERRNISGIVVIVGTTVHRNLVLENILGGASSGSAKFFSLHLR